MVERKIDLLINQMLLGKECVQIYSDRNGNSLLAVLAVFEANSKQKLSKKFPDTRTFYAEYRGVLVELF